MQWITVGYPRNTSQKRLEIYWDIRPLSLSLSLLYIYIYILSIIIGYDWAMWPRSHGSLFTLTWGYPQRREVFQQLRVHFGMGDDFDRWRLPPDLTVRNTSRTIRSMQVMWVDVGPYSCFLKRSTICQTPAKSPCDDIQSPPYKPLHPNNITWHPLGSHASFFFWRSGDNAFVVQAQITVIGIVRASQPTAGAAAMH